MNFEQICLKKIVIQFQSINYKDIHTFMKSQHTTCLAFDLTAALLLIITKICYLALKNQTLIYVGESPSFRSGIIVFIKLAVSKRYQPGI